MNGFVRFDAEKLAGRGMSFDARIGARRGAAGAASNPPVKPGEFDATAARSGAAAGRIGAGFGAGLRARGAARGASIAVGVVSRPVNPHTPGGSPVDAEFVLYRLGEAGGTLLALPNTGYSTRLRTSTLEIVRAAVEAYGAESLRVRPATPSAAQITRMDEALGWIPMMAADRFVLRRIVGARCLVSPMTGRHLFSWRRLAKVLGADHKAVQRWHAQGVDMIVAALNRPGM